MKRLACSLLLTVATAIAAAGQAGQAAPTAGDVEELLERLGKIRNAHRAEAERHYNLGASHSRKACDIDEAIETIKRLAAPPRAIQPEPED